MLTFATYNKATNPFIMTAVAWNAVPENFCILQINGEVRFFYHVRERHAFLRCDKKKLLLPFCASDLLYITTKTPIKIKISARTEIAARLEGVKFQPKFYTNAFHKANLSPNGRFQAGLGNLGQNFQPKANEAKSLCNFKGIS